MKIKRVFKIISIMLLIMMLFPYTSVVFAVSVGDAGLAIATFAKWYYDEVQKGTQPYIWHPYNNPPNGNNFYKGRALLDTGYPKATNVWGKMTPVNSSGKNSNYYGLDCVGWVNFCIAAATGLKVPGIKNDNTQMCYVSPNKGPQYYFTTVPAGSTIQPGDVLYNNSPHELIAINSTLAIESTSNGHPVYGGESKSVKNHAGPYLTEKLTGYNIARITDEAAGAIESVITDSSLLVGGVSGLSMSSATESEFYYNGIPDGEYSVAGSFWEWIIQALLEIFSFLINIIFYIVRMVFVGFTAIVDNLITYIVKSIAGVEANFFKDATSGWRNDGKDIEKVNIETIIFGEEDPSTGEKNHIFDVNFFKPAPATP